MPKRSLLLVVVQLVLTSASQAQYPISYLQETPVHKNDKETLSFVQTVTTGKTPPAQLDGQYRTYAIQQPFILLEYKIQRDTCVMAGIHFRSNAGLYRLLAQEIKAESKPFGDNRRKEMNTRKIIFTFDDQQGVATAIGFDVALGILRQKGY
jgi:hypothetical protein